MLTEALAKKVVPRRDVPAYVARQLLRVVGRRVHRRLGTRRAERQRGTGARADTGRCSTTRAIAGANVQNGRGVFQRTCGACHKLYGEGGTIGPDITGSNRANLDYLLFNVLNPNAEVQDAYKMVVVTTRDGRTLAGNVVAETDRQITLRVVGQDAVVINKSDIQSRETTAVSMMPPGLFDSLADREVIDLVAYLRTAAPVKAP